MTKEFKKPEGRTEVSSISPGALFKEGKVGVVLEAEYVKTNTGEDGEGKEYLMHFFKDDNGIETMIFGCGSLNYMMKDINPGDYCQVEYKGKVKKTTGRLKGKEIHQFEVLVA